MQRIRAETEALPGKEGHSGKKEMTLVSLKRLAGVLGLLLLTVSAFGQAPAAESSIDLKMRQKDRRLDTPVSFSADRMYLGELMEALSTKSHVALEIDNKDRFSGIEITCDLKRTPLADAMNALSSLLGSKNGDWEWVADTRQAPVRYTLSPSQAARGAADRLKRDRQAAFEKLADLTLLLNAMSPEERKANRDKFTPAMQTFAPELDARLVDFAPAKTFWDGITLFSDLLGPEDWILPGDRATLPADQAPLTNLTAARPDSIWDNAPLPDRNIAQLADAQRASFMAVVPETSQYPLISPTGETIAQHFDAAWKRPPHLMHKWREGILLVSYPAWFYGDEGAVPYEILKRLRTSARKQNGLLTLEDLAEPITTLSAAQRKRLSVEFPPIGTPFDAPAMPNQPATVTFRPMAAISAFYTRYPQSLKEAVPVDAGVEAFLQKSGLWVAGLQPDEHVVTVRIIDEGDRIGPDAQRIYVLQFATSWPRLIEGARVYVRRIEPKPRP